MDGGYGKELIHPQTITLPPQPDMEAMLVEGNQEYYQRYQ
jgi:hypothetical protein